MVWPGGDGMVYVMAWRGMTWYIVCPGWYGIWFGLVGMAWYVVWPDGHGTVYGMAWRAWHEKGMAWRAWHNIWYGLTMHGIAWCMVWPGGPLML